jgi:hypothetical protein
MVSDAIAKDSVDFASRLEGASEDIFEKDRNHTGGDVTAPGRRLWRREQRSSKCSIDRRGSGMPGNGLLPVRCTLERFGNDVVVGDKTESDRVRLISQTWRQEVIHFLAFEAKAES